MGCIKETDSSDPAATEKTAPLSAQSNQDTTADPVNVVTGAFTLSEQDVVFPTQRLWLELARHYNNQLHEADPIKAPPPFGRGWTHSLHLCLEPGPEPGQQTYVDDHGTRLTFRLDDQLTRYVAPPGALGLTLTPTGTGGFRLRQIDGLTAEFDPRGRIVALSRPGPGAESRLDFRYDALGRLLAVEGAGGRMLGFVYGGESTLILAVTDHTGRRWQYRYNEHHELVEVHDPAGRVRRYGYDVWQGLVATGKGEMEPRTLRAMNKVFQRVQEGNEPAVELINQYTSDQRVYCQTDALRNVTRFEYNRFTRITYVTDAAGWTTVYGYDGAGNTTKVRRPSGGTTEYIFDNRRNLLAELDPFGYRTEYVELKEPHCLEREQEFGRRAIANRSDYLTISPDDIALGYDERGNRPLVRDALGNVTRFYDYTPFGRPQRILLPNGHEIHVQYDERSGYPVRREQLREVGDLEPLRWVQEYSYDRWGNLTRHLEWGEDLRGERGATRVMAVEYDAEGHHPLSKRSWNESGGEGETFAAEERYEWDALGSLIALTIVRRDDLESAPTLLTTRFGYDLLGRQIWQLDPEGTAIVRDLDLEGRVTEIFTVPQAQPTELLAVPVSQRQERRRWKYDALGREVRFIDPLGAVTEREWDERGLCVAVIDPLGYTAQFDYDRDGNPIRQYTSTGYEIVTSYDWGARPVARQDSLGHATTYHYDPLGRVQAIGEGAQKQSWTRYAYDSLGWLSTILFADGAREQRVYDELGNLVRREQGWEEGPAAATEIFGYDALGRLTDIWAGPPTAPTRQFAVVYNDPAREVLISDALGNVTREGYDSVGNLIRKTDGEGRILRLTYDSKQRLRERHAPDRSVAARYEYDGSDRLIGASEGSIQYQWHYDAAGKVIRHNQILAEQHTSLVYEYDRAGRPTNKQLGQSWWMRYRYSPDSSFVAAIEIPGATVTLVSDPAGRVTEEQWSDGGRTRYEYQPDGELAALESYDGQHQLVFGQRFERDGRGRPVRELRRFPRQETRYDYHYDALDRLERVGRQQGNSASEFRRYVYDEHGNRLQEYREGMPFAAYHYDAANRLRERQDSRGTAQYSYDRCGNLIQDTAHTFAYDAAQRLRQVARAGDATPTATYHYAATDARALITRPQGVEHLFYDGNQEVSSLSPEGTRLSFWGFQVDTLLAADASPASRRAYTSANGSVVTFDPARGMQDYDPFGAVIAPTTLQPLPFGFCGKRFDSETGFYHNRARSYDPVVGRFTQPDPMGTIDGPNLYAYARNNPLVYTDPLGFESQKGSQGGVWAQEPKGGVWPKNPDNLNDQLNITPYKDDISKKHGTRIVEWRSGVIRIRFEEHAKDPGTYNPRHHGPHYHVWVRQPGRGWRHSDNEKVVPPGYQRGSGTGFIPGEKIPAVVYWGIHK